MSTSTGWVNWTNQINRYIHKRLNRMFNHFNLDFISFHQSRSFLTIPTSLNVFFYVLSNCRPKNTIAPDLPFYLSLNAETTLIHVLLSSLMLFSPQVKLIVSLQCLKSPFFCTTIYSLHLQKILNHSFHLFLLTSNNFLKIYLKFASLKNLHSLLSQNQYLNFPLTSYHPLSLNTPLFYLSTAVLSPSLVPHILDQLTHLLLLLFALAVYTHYSAATTLHSLDLSAMHIGNSTDW